VSVAALEQTLRDLTKVGTLVKDRPYRQVWRFESAGKGYYLKFYPRPGSRLKRMVRGNPAMREFLRLQWLQKAKVPAPRAVAVLSGFTIGKTKGDAVISEAIEPAVQLDRYLNGFELRGERAPDHLQLAKKVRELIKALGDARYGHDDLHLGNFLRGEDGSVYLLDAYAVTPGGLKMNQLMRLGHSVARYATRQDVRRGWELLAPDSEIPRSNPLSANIWRKSAGRIGGGNAYFGRVTIGEWSGVFFRQWKYPHRFSPASRLEVAEKDWPREWPVLLEKVEAGLLEVLKSSASGDVLAGEVTLAGRPVEVIVKRARRKHWYRYVNEIGRGSRSWRAWKKAWNLLIRGIPTAWPLLLMERRVMGYVVDQAIVFERAAGKTLATTNLDLLDANSRATLFHRCGRILRRIEDVGFSHFDSKASNWIVSPDEVRGPTPVLVDVDGVRFYRWNTFGIRRLLRSMREHRQYTPADSLALCRGYAPFTRMEREIDDEDAAIPEEESPA
jgi:tRNA A-37 threonylcarbamoyl transferase component Bud32